MKAQQLATILLPLFLCVQGQRYVPYGLGLGGIPSGQVPAENIIRAPPLPNAPISNGPSVNYNLPIGHSYKRPEGEYGIASVVQNGRLAIPNGATVAANGNGRLTQALGLGSIYVERGANGASLTHPGRLVRIQKRSADESLDAAGSHPETKVIGTPTYRKREEYDHGSLYRLAKEALKKNPRKGISFKKAEGSYGIASIHEGSTPPRSVDAEELKKLEDKINQEYAVQNKAPSSPVELRKFVEVPLEQPTGVSFETAEGAYGVSPAFYPFHSRHRRQAVGSGSVTAVLVDFDGDGDDAAPAPPTTNSFAPVVGFTVREPEGGTPSKHILKNVVFRKRPDGVKPTLSAEAPKKHVLRIPDSIELPPFGVSPRKTAEESPDLQTVALPAGHRASKRPTSRKPTSVATIEFRPTFPVEHIHPALPPLPTSPPRTSKPSQSHSPSHDSAQKKALAKTPADSHKLDASPLVAVPPGQVVYNRQLAASVPVQPVHKISAPSRPPAVPTLRPAPTGRQFLTQPQLRPATQQTVQVRQPLQPQATVIAQPPPIHTVGAPQAVASPYPGALYQQYTPFDPATYQVPQPVQTFQPAHYTLPYSAIVGDPYIQARIARSTAAKQQGSAFDASSVYDLSRRIIQGVHS
ncbi:uncharacterized protein LOC144153760 [Haemaphysalis longicornis]